jgi:TldD protein
VRDLIAGALKGHNADYVEAHFEESQSTYISYRNGRLEEVNRTSSNGGNVRALVRGGWGFVSFNRLDGLRDRAALAVKEATLASGQGVNVLVAEPAVDIVAIEKNKDPANMPVLSQYRAWDCFVAVPSLRSGLRLTLAMKEEARRRRLRAKR